MITGECQLVSLIFLVKDSASLAEFAIGIKHARYGKSSNHSTDKLRACQCHPLTCRSRLCRIILVPAAIGLHEVAFAGAGPNADQGGRASAAFAANFLVIQLATALGAAARFAFQFQLRTRTGADHLKKLLTAVLSNLAVLPERDLAGNAPKYRFSARATRSTFGTLRSYSRYVDDGTTSANWRCAFRTRTLHLPKPHSSDPIDNFSPCRAYRRSLPHFLAGCGLFARRCCAG